MHALINITFSTNAGKNSLQKKRKHYLKKACSVLEILSVLVEGKVRINSDQTVSNRNVMNKRAFRPESLNPLNGAHNFGKILSSFGQLEIQCTE